MCKKRHNGENGKERDNVNAGSNENVGSSKKGRKPKKKMYKCIIFTIILAVVIIACPVIVPILFMIYNAEGAAQGAESTLLATGIAIIGVAITAWTGLNIANSVNRKELEKVDRKAKKIKRKMGKKFNQFKENRDEQLNQLKKDRDEQLNQLKKDTDEQLNQLKKDSEDIKKSVENSLIDNHNSFFLQELLKTVKDTCSLYFYKEFNVFFSEQKYDTVKSSLLMEIEQCFVEIYNLHNDKSEEHELLISKADIGLNKITEYESNEQPKGIVKQYLDYRRCEINYYKGYCEEKPSNVYECFMEAIDIYTDFAKQLGITMEYNKQENKEIPDYNGPFLEMACYLSGSIGDSYSGIVNVCKGQERFRTKRGYITKEQIIDYAEKAIYFCGCAAKWSEGSEFEREVYFRNLGCAYERLDNINETPFLHKNEIMYNYKHAFKKMHNDISLIEKRKQNIYHTILSYFHKYFKEEFSKLDGGCLKYTPSKYKLISGNAEEMAEYRDEMAKMISNIKEQGNDVIDVKMLNDYVIIARSGVEHNPHFTLRISLLGLSYTYVIFLIKAGNESAKQVFSKPLEYYIAEIEKLISYLDVIEMKDDYANELRLRYKGIMEI